jgi:DNA-binding response OmpR family regulator
MLTLTVRCRQRPERGHEPTRPRTRRLRVDRDEIAVGHVLLLPSERQLFLNGTRAHLSAREVDVLLVLAVGAGKVVNRERIYEHVWGRPMPHARDRAVEISPGWTYIHIHFGHGYRFDPERAERRRPLP